MRQQRPDPIDMPHSHHSHSGDYIAHGVDPLDSVIARVLDLQFHTYCLTEHMPRLNDKFLYPEEIESHQDTATLKRQFQRYLEHARVIKRRVNNDSSSRTRILIGAEIDVCDRKHIEYAKLLLEKEEDIQFLVGSCHHVEGVPIDFDLDTWMQALHKTAGNNIKIFLKKYFQTQYEMLHHVKPLVVGHFDLIRLFFPQCGLSVNPATGDVVSADVPGAVAVADICSDKIMTMWDEVQAEIIKNLKFVDSYGGAIEINTSGLRKKLKYPYPHKDISDLVKQYCGARFVLSDDAHGVSQVATNYLKALDFIQKDLGLQQMFYLEENEITKEVHITQQSIEDFSKDVFWDILKQKRI